MSVPRRRARGGNDQPTRAPVDADIAGLPARKTAARLLGAVIDTRTSLDGLTDNEHGHPHYLALEMRDRSLVRAILTTALRFRRTTQALIDARLDRPLPANASALNHVLHVAAAQMLFLDVPDSAAVDLAVSHARSDPRTTRFASLVNAVLREIGRRKERALPAALDQTIDAPDWLRDRMALVYGEARARAIFDAHRREAPVDLTVKSDAPGWASRLGGTMLPSGTVRLARLSGPITELEGFADGHWWVQDVAAAMPARLFGNIAGLRVADLCAAPGGKTAQLAQAGATVTALELSANRARRLTSNLQRLRLDAEVIVADLTTFEPDTPFDAVLLDAPCSSTGTIRRHPDVAWTKGPDDIAKLASVQRRMLESAARLVRPGGVVVFSNCSLDPIEGEHVVRDFLTHAGNMRLKPVVQGEFAWADAHLAEPGWLRTTPADLVLETTALSGMDGFFAARLRRVD